MQGLSDSKQGVTAFPNAVSYRVTSNATMERHNPMTQNHGSTLAGLDVVEMQRLMAEATAKLAADKAEAEAAMADFAAMSAVARSLATGATVEGYEKWVSIVHPFVKGENTSYASVNAFVGAIYGVVYPSKAEKTKLTKDESKAFVKVMSHYQRSLKNGNDLRGVKVLSADETTGETTVDVEKIASRIITRLSDLSLDDAVKVSNLIGAACDKRKAEAERIMAAQAEAEAEAQRKAEAYAVTVREAQAEAERIIADAKAEAERITANGRKVRRAA